MTLTAVDHECEITGVGNVNAEVMIIGIAPGRHEYNRSRIPFTGPAGKLLTGTLEAWGIKREDVWLTNLICWFENDPTPNEIARCWQRLQTEINAINPRLIIMLGETVQNAFFDKKLRRGFLNWHEGRWWMATLHPSAYLRDVNNKLDIADFARDIGKINTFPKEPYEIESFHAESVEEANDWLWNATGVTAIDIETSYDGKPFVYPDEGLVGTDDSKILCFSICSEDDRISRVIPGRFVAGLTPGWASREGVIWLTHGGIFDAAQFYKLLGERIIIGEDSLLESYSLDERSGDQEENTHPVGIHGLKIIAAEFHGIVGYDINVLEAKMEELHHYNAIDAYVTLRSHLMFKPRQIADNVREMYENILIPAANTLSESQARGIKINTAKMQELGIRWSQRWIEMEARLKEWAHELGWPDDRINVGSWQQLQKFLFNILKCRPHPHFKKSTRKEVIEWLAPKTPWCQLLLDWRKVNHILTTYIMGVMDDIKYDGKIHPMPVLHGTRSGRLGYKNPPIATIPHYGVDPEFAALREMFIPDNGDRIYDRLEDVPDDDYVFLEADLKQAELWATAYLSGDETMLASLKRGDAHGDTAKMVFEVDESHNAWKGYRELGKLFNFGTLYNRTAGGYAGNPFQGRKPPEGLEDFKLTKAQAQIIIDKQFENWPMVKEWQRVEIRKAMREGEQQMITGRKRRYWLPNYKTVNQAVNIGPQSIAHDYLLNSFVKLHKMLSEFASYILFEVHDALMIEVRKGWLDEVGRLVAHVMTEPKFGLGGIPVDMSVGTNWANVKKWNPA